MRAVIDVDRCQGHGRCYDFAPGIFDADDEGYGHVIEDLSIVDAERASAELAMANCPERAISLLEDH